MVYTIDCPVSPQPTIVSRDSQLFQNVQRRCGHEPAAPAAVSRPRLYVLELTDACDLECSICYAACNSAGRAYLELETARQLLVRIRQDSGRHVSLTGGEPTLHPELPEIIRIALQECGRPPVLVTNGRLSGGHGAAALRNI